MPDDNLPERGLPPDLETFTGQQDHSLPCDPAEMRSLGMPALAQQIKAAHEQCLGAMQQTLDHALTAGRLLIQAKERIGHGRWLTWLADECRLPVRQAQRYMQVARNLSELDKANATRVSFLSLREALELTGRNVQKLKDLPGEDTAEILDYLDGHEHDVGRFARMPINVHTGRERHISSKRRKMAQRAAQTRAKQREAVYPIQHPRDSVRLCGFDEAELGVILEELKRSGDWYHSLAQKLNTHYEPGLTYEVTKVAHAIWDLSERLDRDRTKLLEADRRLRGILSHGPTTGDKVREWARDAHIPEGLLFLAANQIGVKFEPADSGKLSHACTWSFAD